jgi:hypothetical protein
LAFDAAAIIAILALSALSAVLAFRLWNARKAAATGRVEVASLTRELDESRARIDALLARGDGVLAFDAGRIVRFRKVGTRRAQAISKVVLALSYREDGGVMRDVRVALGSVAATPIRATETERVLEGAAHRETVADHAAATLGRELKPIDDVRSTADYRRAVSARVLHRLLRDEGGW